MTWIPWSAIKDGGPWVVLVMLAIMFLLARSRGILTTEKDVERTVGGYKAVIEYQASEITHLRATNDKQGLTIEKLSEQNAKLMKGVDLSTYAIESVLREAKHHDQLDS